MKYSFLTALTVCLTYVCTAQTNPKWARYPAISPDGTTIAFTYKGNLFSVPTEGGVAKQLTYHSAHDYKAVWSKDGKKIAFASNRYGNFDVYVMDAQGGEATRLTYHSNDETPYSFSADDSDVLFGANRLDIAEHRQYPTGSQPELYSVPVNGGRVGQVLTVPVEDAQVNTDGSKMVYHDKKGYEDTFRKHHTSAITRDIWSYDPSTGKHKQLTTFKGEDRNPVFSKDGNAIYYLSEQEGTFNVFSMSLTGAPEIAAHTSFKIHPVRSLSIGDNTLAFGYDGEIYTLKAGEGAKKVEIIVRTQEDSNPIKYVSVNGGVQEMDVAPNGKEIAFISRGRSIRNLGRWFVD